ncbi:hypothetical protein GCM10027275_09020 [Rhabdobacter roseus]|uniref:Uncharacterized protein n=1 Tax=Rhabdobacter roseus TaxID=1655419 RepID=A0A840TMM4_9BACT|nr:hypothetical protein [Rhabdobacter roseus]MBB5282802.1 hypothetical protein [Rhabdobacter roseus]
MKKHLLWGIVGSLCLALPVRAQFSQGTRYWGGTVSTRGTLGFGNDASGRKSRSGFHEVQPEIQFGKFTSATTMLGVGARYSINWNGTSIPTDEYKSRVNAQSVALLPYLRKYKSLNERWWLFLHTEAGAAYHWRINRTEYQGPGQEFKRSSWQYLIEIKPGVVCHFPRKGWAIEGYANILSLTAQYQPNDQGSRYFLFSSGFGTNVPSYLTLRIARYTNPKSN